MFPLFLRKFNILKKQNTKPVQRQIKSVQTKPLQKDFRCTKDLFSYAKKRCIDALNNEAPYEHVVIADIKKNKVLTEFIGEENKCNIEGIENFNLDKENTVVIHGHSDSTPISVCDMYTLLKNNLGQIIAIDKKGQFSLVAKTPNMSNDIDAKYKKFDETMALLAGYALLTYSFRLLADAYMNYPKVATGLVFDLADAGGSTKMIGGQVEDVLGERDGKMTPDKLNFIHHNKTAALITAAVTMGIRLADDYDELKLQAAREIGKNIGLAFQVIDDILDVTSDEATLGKTTGLDAANEKMTYVSLYGIEKSREIAAQLTQKAISDCEKLSPNCDFPSRRLRGKRARTNRLRQIEGKNQGRLQVRSHYRRLHRLRPRKQNNGGFRLRRRNRWRIFRAPWRLRAPAPCKRRLVQYCRIH